MQCINPLASFVPRLRGGPEDISFLALLASLLFVFSALQLGQSPSGPPLLGLITMGACFTSPALPYAVAVGSPTSRQKSVSGKYALSAPGELRIRFIEFQNVVYADLARWPRGGAKLLHRTHIEEDLSEDAQT